MSLIPLFVMDDWIYKQLVMPHRQKVTNHHLEMVMMTMEMMKTQEKEQREKQQVQLLEEQPVQKNW